MQTTERWGRFPPTFREEAKRLLSGAEYEIPGESAGEGSVEADGNVVFVCRSASTGHKYRTSYGTFPGFSPGQAVRYKTVYMSAPAGSPYAQGVIMKMSVSELNSETGTALLGGMHFEWTPNGEEYPDVCSWCGSINEPGDRLGYDCGMCGGN